MIRLRVRKFSGRSGGGRFTLGVSFESSPGEPGSFGGEAAALLSSISASMLGFYCAIALIHPTRLM